MHITAVCRSAKKTCISQRTGAHWAQYLLDWIQKKEYIIALREWPCTQPSQLWQRRTRMHTVSHCLFWICGIVLFGKKCIWRMETRKWHSNDMQHMFYVTPKHHQKSRKRDETSSSHGNRIQTGTALTVSDSLILLWFSESGPPCLNQVCSRKVSVQIHRIVQLSWAWLVTNVSVNLSALP